MDSDSYRLRDHQEGCAGPTSVHRAEPPGRPGRLVRLTRLTGDAAGPRTEDVVETWRALPHPSLLPISSSHRDAGGLLLVAPMASARPLDHLDTASSPLPIATLAQVGGTIAAGLEVLHAHGVVHGMVDGHTILLTSDGTSVLDGPWHPACRRRRRGRGAPVAPSGTGRAVTAAGDVRALAVTLLHHLAAVERAGTAAAGDELRALLEGQRDHPGGAAAFEAELAGWLQSCPSPSPDLSTARPVPAPPGPRPAEQAVRS